MLCPVARIRSSGTSTGRDRLLIGHDISQRAPKRNDPEPGTPGIQRTGISEFFETVNDIIVVAATGRFSTPTGPQELHYDDHTGMHVLEMHPVNTDGKPRRSCCHVPRERDFCPVPLLHPPANVFRLKPGLVWRMGRAGLHLPVSKDLSLLRPGPIPQTLQQQPGTDGGQQLPQRRFIEVNEAFLSHLGYTRQDVIGRTATELESLLNEKRR